MPPKRKITPEECSCGLHSVDKPCKALELKEHITMTNRIVTYSKTIDIFVGKNKQAFSVSRDLAMIHSARIRDLILENQDQQDYKLVLERINPAVFSDFISWIYTGQFLDIPTKFIKRTYLTTWLLAEYLQIPSMKNACMDGYRKHASRSHEEGNWPSIKIIQSIYDRCPKGSIPRKFATHSMVCKNPFEIHEEDSPPYMEWKTFLDSCPELASDVAMAAGKRWNKTFAWDDEHREAYMETPTDLGKEWEEHILRTRGREEVERDARDGCFRSIIELRHLKSRPVVVG